MPSDYTPSATRHATITTIAGNDFIGSVVLSTPHEEVADNIEELDQSIRAGTLRFLPFFGAAPESVTNWVLTPTGWYHAAGNAAAIHFDLVMPARTRITLLRLRVQGASGHASLPVTMPEMTLHRFDGGMVAGSGSILATTVDSSVDVAAYQSAHNIDISLSHAIDTAYMYRVRLAGESVYQTGLTIMGFRGSWERV